MSSRRIANLSWRRLAPIAWSLALAACGGGLDQGSGASPSPAPSTPALQSTVVSSDIVTGRDQRVAIGILNANGVPVPGVNVTVQLFTLPAPGAGQPQALGPAVAAAYKGELLQGKGVYVLHQTFSQPGNYTARVTATKGAT